MNSPEAGRPPLKLRDYLAQVSETVRVAHKAGTWVIAEVSSVTRHGSGHVYFDLVDDRDDRSGTKAKVRASIWASSVGQVLSPFEKAIGKRIEAGMSVLVRVSGAFDPTYGFSLTLLGIDPNYTLGDAAARYRQAMESLARTGDLDLQKKRALPEDFTRIVVISPSAAAGLGDFDKDIQALEKLGVLRVKRLAASFQGRAAEADLLKAIAQAQTYGAIDALIIIRGGGSAADLAELNLESVARALARCSATVVTGIGHERDRGLLDEVACVAFGTPSKVAAHIRAAIVNAAVQGDANINQFHRWILQVAQDAARNLTVQESAFDRSLRQCVSQAQAESRNLVADMEREIRRSVSQVQREMETGSYALSAGARRVAQDAQAFLIEQPQLFHQALAGSLERARSGVEEATESLARDLRRITLQISAAAQVQQETLVSRILQACAMARSQAEDRHVTLHGAIRRRIAQTKTLLAAWAQGMSHLEPRRVLALGYSLVRSADGHLVRSPQDAIKAQALTITTAEGEYQAHAGPPSPTST